MTTFNADLYYMGEAKAQLARIAGQLLAIGDDLRGKIDIGTADFQGATKDQFILAQQAYDRAHEAVQQIVMGSSTTLDDINLTYIDNEVRGSRRWTV